MEFAAFAEANRGKLCAIALRTLNQDKRDHCEDIVQEALLATWQNWSRIEQPLPYVGQTIRQLVWRCNRQPIHFSLLDSQGNSEQALQTEDMLLQALFAVEEEEERERTLARRRRILNELPPWLRREWERWQAAGYLTFTNAHACANSRMRKELTRRAGGRKIEVHMQYRRKAR